jgi:hypothetical protein
MRLAVIIKAEQKEVLPTAAELREAGFVVSTALGTGREANGPYNSPPGKHGGEEEPDHAAPNQTDPICPCLPERRSP